MISVDFFFVSYTDDKSQYQEMIETALALDPIDFVPKGYRVDEERFPYKPKSTSVRKGKGKAVEESDFEEPDEPDEDDSEEEDQDNDVDDFDAVGGSRQPIDLDDDLEDPVESPYTAPIGRVMTSPLVSREALKRRRIDIAPRNLFDDVAPARESAATSTQSKETSESSERMTASGAGRNTSSPSRSATPQPAGPSEPPAKIDPSLAEVIAMLVKGQNESRIQQAEQSRENYLFMQEMRESAARERAEMDARVDHRIGLAVASVVKELPVILKGLGLGYNPQYIQPLDSMPGPSSSGNDPQQQVESAPKPLLLMPTPPPRGSEVGRTDTQAAAAEDDTEAAPAEDNTEAEPAEEDNTEAEPAEDETLASG